MKIECEVKKCNELHVHRYVEVPAIHPSYLVIVAVDRSDIVQVPIYITADTAKQLRDRLDRFIKQEEV